MPFVGPPAACMFSVLQAHALWPRGGFWSTLGCPSATAAPLLRLFIHAGPELLCMPGFVTVAALQVGTARSHADGTVLLLISVASLLCSLPSTLACT